MLRHAVTAWFLLVTLLGPGTCCCSLVAAVVARLGVAATAPALPSGTRRCCHDTKHAPQRNNPNQSEKPAPANCPCKTVTAQAALRVAAVESECARAPAWSVLLSSLAPPAIAPPVPEPLLPADASRPFLKPRDLLPILRC